MGPIKVISPYNSAKQSACITPGRMLPQPRAVSVGPSCLRGILLKEVTSTQHESADMCLTPHGGAIHSEVDPEVMSPMWQAGNRRMIGRL